jgi:hypothetical protein
MKRIGETPKRHILGRNRVYCCITCGARTLRVGCAFAQQVTRKKTPLTVYFTYMGSRDPQADHYELWPTWWSHRRYQMFKLLY